MINISMDNYSTAPEQFGPSFREKVTQLLEKKPVIYQFMRFGCIGSMNTALNFLILNTVSKAFSISQGLSLGMVGALAFCGAVIQSYLWNRTWTFGGETGVSLFKNFERLVLIGLFGFVTVVIILVASKMSAPWEFFASLLLAYLAAESVLWKRFGFHLSDWNHESHSFVVFFIVTLIGLGINVFLISFISTHVHLTDTDLDKNIAAIAATGVSLFWNFMGYKVIVFKK